MLKVNHSQQTLTNVTTLLLTACIYQVYILNENHQDIFVTIMQDRKTCIYSHFKDNHSLVTQSNTVFCLIAICNTLNVSLNRTGNVVVYIIFEGD